MAEGRARRTRQEDKPDYRLLEEGGDPYLYPDTAAPVLRNRFGIKDAAQLGEVERVRTVVRLEELRSHDVKVSTSLSGLQAVHRHIFQDMYHWAGHVRKVNLHKPEPVLSGASVNYSEHGQVRQEAHAAFRTLTMRDWSAMNLGERAQTLSKDLAEVWRTHPFREGNTRTVVAFAGAFGSKRGMSLDLKLLGQHSDYVRTSLVVATYGRTEDLARIMQDALERGQSLTREKGRTLDLTATRDLER